MKNIFFNLGAFSKGSHSNVAFNLLIIASSEIKNAIFSDRFPVGANCWMRGTDSMFQNVTRLYSSIVMIVLCSFGKLRKNTGLESFSLFHSLGMSVSTLVLANTMATRFFRHQKLGNTWKHTIHVCIVRLLGFSRKTFVGKHDRVVLRCCAKVPQSCHSCEMRNRCS